MYNFNPLLDAKINDKGITKELKDREINTQMLSWFFLNLGLHPVVGYHQVFQL